VNGVNLDIDRMVQKKLTRRSLDSTSSLPRDASSYNNKKLRWIRLPYLGEFLSKLTRVLRPFGFRPAFYNLTTVKGLIVRLEDPIPRRERRGMYRLTCRDCNIVYIGETSR